MTKSKSDQQVISTKRTRFTCTWTKSLMCFDEVSEAQSCLQR